MKQYAVIGLGSFGSSLARTLVELGHEVLGIDRDADRVDELNDRITHAVQADATDEIALRALGMRNFDAAIVTIGEDIQASVLCTLLCKEMGVRLVVAKASNELHAKVLGKIGADRIVFPERDMGVRVAHSLTSANVMDFIELSPEYSLVEVSAPSAWWGLTLKDIGLRGRLGVNVMAIRRGKEINVAPTGGDDVQEGDVLVVIGATEAVREIG